MAETTDKIKNFIKQNFGYFIVFFACAIYIARGLITIDKTGKTVYEIIVDGSLAFFFGVFINRIMDLQGMANGERDDRVIKTNTLHSKVVDEITPYIDKLDDWCDRKNKEALKLARIRILKGEGLKYDDCFDEDATPKDYTIDFNKYYYKGKDREKLFEKQKERNKYKSYLKACKLKLTLLTTNALTNDGGKEYDPYYLGRTKVQYEKETSRSEIISKIAIAVITGIYGIKLIKDFSWANLLWVGIQVVLFLLIGGIKMLKSMFFIIDEYRARTIKKIDNLQKFKAECCQDNKEENKVVAIGQNQAQTIENRQENNQVVPEIKQEGENING